MEVRYGNNISATNNQMTITIALVFLLIFETQNTTTTTFGPKYELLMMDVIVKQSWNEVMRIS